MVNEPAAKWQAQVHRLIVSGDPIIFAQLCEVALPHLVAFLTQLYPQHERHAIEGVAIDLLLSYQSNPQQYNPEKLTLFAYLRMAARYDMLTSIKASERYNARLLALDDAVSLASEAPLFDRLAVEADYPFENIMRLVEQELNATERRVLSMMLNGIRETEQFATVLGIANQSKAAQRREVKRVKDRINKRLRRLGKRIRR